MPTTHEALKNALDELRSHLTAPPFSLSPEDPLLPALAAASRPRALEGGAVLCREGAAADRLWWLVAGELVVTVEGEDGTPVEVVAAGPGSLVGESALLRGTDARRTATLTAREATTVLEVPVDAEVRRAYVRSALRHRLDALEAERDAGRSLALVREQGPVVAANAGARRIDLARGDRLAPSAEPELRFILSGALIGSLGPDDAREATRILRPEDDLGAQSALRGEVTDETLYAMEASELIAIGVAEFRRAAEAARGNARLVAALDRLAAPGAASPVPASGAFGWKTLLFLPQFAFEKAWQMGADAFIVDFQDAVPMAAKAPARAGLRRALEAGDLGDRPIVVRINETAVGEEQRLDLDAVVGLPGVTALMPTMIEHARELDALHEELCRRERALGLPEGATKLLPLIETPAAVLRVDAIAQAGGGRLVGLFLGHGDLFRLTGAKPHGESTLDYPRNAVVFAARAAGIAAFDTPYTKVSDTLGLEREAREAKRHGFDGKACIHRDQIATVARCLRPGADELAWAQRVERARRNGLLSTLIRKLDDPETARRANRQTDGMALVDGQLVGPPHIKSSQRILSLSVGRTLPPVGRGGRVVAHRSEAGLALGAEIDNPYEFTVTDGMRDLWAQCFYSHDAAQTSCHYAAALGRCDGRAMPVPFLMAMYLGVSMSDTHGAVFHLGFRNARQHLPLQVGDTVRQRIRVLRVRNTSDGKNAVVTTLRELVRVEDERVVLRVEKAELYRAQPTEFGEARAAARWDAALPEGEPLLAAALDGAPRALALRPSAVGVARPRERLAAGDVLLHSFARPLGVSANLALSTQFLVTHPIHLDHHRFDQGGGTGVVVSGGLVISMICGAAARDVSHVIWEELIAANNVRPVSPGETVGALSVIVDRAEVPSHPALEALVVKTIGVKGVTPAAELADTFFPEPLLAPEVGGGGRYDDVCRSHGPGALEGRVVGEVLRRMVRVKPVGD